MDTTAGVRLGGAEVQDPEERLESAVELAKDVDAVIAVVGLNADWYENPSVGKRDRSVLTRRGYCIKGGRRSRSHDAGSTREDK